MADTRMCSRCREIKPLDLEHFYREPHGCAGLKTICKVCHNERTDAWARANPEKRRASDRASKRRGYQRMKDDPERIGNRRTYEREWHRTRLGIMDRPERWKRGKRQIESTGRAGCPAVPVGPFAEWLRTVGDNGEAIAARTGMSPRRVWSVLNGEQESVEVDTVDRAILTVGDGTTFDDIYGVLVLTG